MIREGVLPTPCAPLPDTEHEMASGSCVGTIFLGGRCLSTFRVGLQSLVTLTRRGGSRSSNVGPIVHGLRHVLPVDIVLPHVPTDQLQGKDVSLQYGLTLAFSNVMLC